MSALDVWWSPALDAEIEDSSGLIENAYSGYWRQNETGGWTRIDELPADAVRLVPDSGQALERLRVAGRNLLDALEEAEVDESFNPPTVANLRHYMTRLSELVKEDR